MLCPGVARTTYPPASLACTAQCTLHNLVQPSSRIWCSFAVESTVHSGAETGAHSAPCQLASNASAHHSTKQSYLRLCVALAESTTPRVFLHKITNTSLLLLGRCSHYVTSACPGRPSQAFSRNILLKIFRYPIAMHPQKSKMAQVKFCTCCLLCIF